ncbi:trans-sialidase, putative, partial [Trypanosoma cruzi]
MCSAWRSDILRGPRMRMPQWCHRLFNRRLAHRSPQKVLAGKTRRKHNRGHSRWTTRDFVSSTAEMPPSLGIGNATAWEFPSPQDDLFRTECSPLLYGRPLRYSLVIVTAYSKIKATSCFAMNVGCTSRGPTIHVVCGDYSFLLLVLLCFCVAVCAAPSLVCVRIFREGCRHDGPLSPYVHAVEPCVPLLFASPSSICVLVLWQGCMCVCACCRGLECVSCVVCGVRCMRGCCPLLV